MINKKEFYVAECDDCGEEYSGHPDCGFTVYATLLEAAEGTSEDDWEQHTDGKIYCSVCAPKHTDPGCINCGCTDEDCSQCVAATGEACHWVGPRKCSRCFDEDGKPKESEALN